MIIIDKQKCTGCGVCADVCPEDILGIEDGFAKVYYPQECWVCGSCSFDCPFEAIKVDLGLEQAIRFIEKVN